MFLKGLKDATISQKITKIKSLLKEEIDMQWNLSRADTYREEVFVRFREVSALEKFELKSSQI